MSESSAPPPSAAQGSSAEDQAALFASDPRVYFAKESGTWRYEADDGAEMEYDPVKSAWLPIVDEDLVKAQQAAYAVPGVDEEAPAAPILARNKKKRKVPEDYTSNTTPGAGPSIKRGKKGTQANDTSMEQKPRKSKNTAVYVTGLPLDTEMDELIERFGKCGVLEEDDDGEPKVKMYAREDGMFSGEALVVYFKEDSVILAVNLLDEAELRLGDSSTRMSVQQAQFGHKEGGGGGGGANGESSQPRKTVDKKKISRRIGKMQKKLEDWDDADAFGPSPDPTDSSTAANKNSRVVVLKHMFTLDELEKDATLLLDLKEDVREECSTLGEVTNVVLYDKEADGVMTVKFRDPISAQACILRMNGRFFDGRRVEAALYSGKQRFNRSGAEDLLEGDDDEAEKKRLADFTAWLLTEGD